MSMANPADMSTLAILRRLVGAYDKQNPARTGDYHRVDCPCLRCVRDDAEAVIGKAEEV